MSTAITRSVDLRRRTTGIWVPRMVAYVIDIVIVGLLTLIASIAVSFLGLLTFGLGWMLFPAIGICTAMAYAAITIGGSSRATLGMRVSDLHVERADGRAPDGLTAAAHCLLFYVAGFTVGLFLLTIFVGLVRRDRRMGHDLLTDLVVVKD